MVMEFTKGEDQYGNNTLSIETDGGAEIIFTFDENKSEILCINFEDHEFEPLDDALYHLFVIVNKEPIQLYELMLEAEDQKEI